MPPTTPPPPPPAPATGEGPPTSAPPSGVPSLPPRAVRMRAMNRFGIFGCSRSHTGATKGRGGMWMTRMPVSLEPKAPLGRRGPTCSGKAA
ncbi:MAG: hypothetical protein EPO57_09125 [Chitinophagaceae bacterium]|nr:MAG: hypothetical protein EPO57_09125 [Chitinophagaceae bacterium]